MSVDLHRQAEALMGQADVLMAKGIKDKAAPLYRQAAELESQVFDGIPITRPRTRGIIAISTVALYRKSGELTKAIREAHQYLTDPELPEFAQEELRDLLFETYREQQARASGRTLAGQGLAVSLRRGSIGLGTAHLDTVVLMFQQIDRYVLRIAEWLAGMPFRERGPVSRDVLQMCTPVLSQPAPGSFQFELRLETPLQPLLPSLGFEPSITPERIARAAFKILDIITNTPATAVQGASEHQLAFNNLDLTVKASSDQLKQEVPDQQYREVFLKLVRVLVPDGREVGEVQISPIGGGERVAILTPEVHKIISRHLSLYTPEPEHEDVLVGVLRGLQLNDGWIVLDDKPDEKKCYIEQHKVFDDVVGPFVNRRVRVPGRFTRTGKQHRFVLRDIVLDTEGTN